MKTRKCQTRAGLTLIEVVVGLVMLSTVLITLLMSFRQHHDRTNHAIQRMEAAEAADELLSMWVSSEVPIPQNTSGVWDNTWVWDTRIVRRETILDTDWVVLRVQLRRSHGEDSPLIQLEILDKPAIGMPMRRSL